MWCNKITATENEKIISNSKSLTEKVVNSRLSDDVFIEILHAM